MTNLKCTTMIHLMVLAVMTAGILFISGTSVAFAEETPSVDEGSIETATAGSLADPGQLLEDYLLMNAQEQLGNAENDIKRAPRYLRLNKYEQQAYDLLKSKIAEIASGDETEALIRLRLGDYLDQDIIDSMSVTSDQVGSILDDNGELTKEASDILYAKYELNFDPMKVIRALLYDCPYELYWFDKTDKYTCYPPSYYVYSSIDGEVTKAECKADSSTIINLMVSNDYYEGKTLSDEGIEYDLVNTTWTKAASNATAKAADIVMANEKHDDYHMLLNYKDTICDLVSYDDAAADESVPYGDPWQVISVFDEYDTTNVVCEGYSKAFKFLCDLSRFESPAVDCYLFDGKSGATDEEGYDHMWNTVRMDDNKYYLVDITNCDDGTVGHRDGENGPDKLFLRGYTKQHGTKALDEGIVVTVDNVGEQSVDMFYDYDNDTINYYDQERTISNEDYIAPQCTAHQFDDFLYKKASYGEDGRMIRRCVRCDAAEDDGQPKPIPCPEEFYLDPDYFVYNGTGHQPAVTIKDREGNTINSSAYKVTYANNVNAGSNAKAIVTFNSNKYTGTVNVLFTISKANNPIMVKAKTANVKFKKLKKKNQTLTVSKILTVSKAQGTKTYTKASGNKKITINKNTGKVTVKKGLKKGTYKVKVKVKASGNANYKALTRTVTFKIKVK